MEVTIPHGKDQKGFQLSKVGKKSPTAIDPRLQETKLALREALIEEAVVDACFKVTKSHGFFGNLRRNQEVGDIYIIDHVTDDGQYLVIHLDYRGISYLGARPKKVTLEYLSELEYIGIGS